MSACTQQNYERFSLYFAFSHALCLTLPFVQKVSYLPMHVRMFIDQIKIVERYKHDRIFDKQNCARACEKH